MSSKRIRGNRNSFNENNKISYWKDVTVLITIITFAGYLAAYCYKVGFLKYYHLNKIFINELSITYILGIQPQLFLVITALLLTIMILRKLSRYPRISLFLFEIAFPVSCLVLTSVNLDYSNSYKFIYGITFIAGYLILVFTSLGGYIQGATFMNSICDGLKAAFCDSYTVEKYMKEEAMVRLISKKIQGVYTSNYIFSSLFTIFLLGILIMASSMYFGSSAAKYKTEYYIVSHNNKDYVIIESIKDSYILSPVNLNESKINTDYLIVKLESTIDNPLKIKKQFFVEGIKINH